MLFASVLFASQRVFAQAEKCEKEVLAKASPLIASRGKDKNIKQDIRNGKRIYLKAYNAKSRGVRAVKSNCMISLYNEVNQEVDVYVDGNYTGSLKAGMQGVIESVSKYERVYCVSVDKMMSWLQNGDCACVYIFKLNK